MSLSAPSVKKGLDRSLRRMTQQERLVRCKQQLYDWTQMYHRGRHAAWIKQNPINPFVIYNKVWKIFGEDRSATWGKSFRRSCSEWVDDIKWVRDGGGTILRDGVPQFNLCDFSMVDNLDDWFLTTDKKEQVEDRSEGQAWIEDGGLVFSGYLHHANPHLGHNQRSPDSRGVGYCNLHTKNFNPFLDLSNYFSLGIKFRSDGRVYLLSLETFIGPENPIHFQGILRLPPTPLGEWDYIEIPFHHFIPTFQGEVINFSAGMDPRFVYSYGIQPVGASGEFRCEVAWVRVNRYDARYVMEEEQTEYMQILDTLGLPLFELQNLFRGGVNYLNIANYSYDSDGEPVIDGPEPLINFGDEERVKKMKINKRRDAIREPRNLSEIENTVAEMLLRRGTENNLHNINALRPNNEYKK